MNNCVQLISKKKSDFLQSSHTKIHKIDGTEDQNKVPKMQNEKPKLANQSILITSSAASTRWTRERLRVKLALRVNRQIRSVLHTCSQAAGNCCWYSVKL